MHDPFRNYDNWKLSTPDDDAADPDDVLCLCGAIKPEGAKRCKECEIEVCECAAEDAADGARDER